MIGSNAEASYRDILLQIEAAARCSVVPGEASIIVLAARTRGEGVTTVTAELAASFAKERGCGVLVLDCSGVGLKLADLMGVAPLPLSLSDLGAAALNPEPWLASARRHSIDVVTLAPPDIGAILASPLMPALLATFRRLYDFLIIDGDTLSSSVARQWSQLGAKLVIVVDARRTTTEILERFGKTLHAAGLVPTGTILNNRRFYIPRFLYRFLR